MDDSGIVERRKNLKYFDTMPVRVISYIICFFSLYMVMGSDRAFRYYNGSIGINIDDLMIIIAIVLGIPSLILFIISILKITGEENSFFRKIHNIDYILCIVISLGGIAVFSYEYLQIITYRINLPQQLYLIAAYFTAFAAFSFGMFLFIITIVRIRGKRLKKTIYWGAFFKKYPVYKPIGLLTAAALAGSTYKLFESYQYVDYGKIAFDTGDFVIAFICLIAIMTLCIHFQSLSSDYERMVEDKVKAEKLKTELITNVSHDIRTPLTSIINYVDLIKKLDLSNEDLVQYISVLERKSTRLKGLIQDLMDASKAHTGNIEIQLENIDLIELIHQMTGEYDEAFTQSQLNLVFQHTEEKILIVADGRQIWRVVENLFGNIIKYSMPDTRVYAEVERGEGEVRFSLKNISKAQLGIPAQELMEQFVRGDRSRNTDGSGLGLYIARELMERMGGSLQLVIAGDLFEAILYCPAVSF